MSWLEEKDDWEGDYGSIIKSYPLGIRFTFDYKSKTGKEPSRTVRVREFGETGFGVMLIGYCEARQATRTFMADRITNCSNADSGDYVDNIPEYLDQEYRKSTDFTLDSLLARYFEAFKLMVYFFRADGKILGSERGQLLQFCLEESRDDRLNDDSMKRLIELVPTLSNHSFKVEVGRLAAEDAVLMSKVLETCQASIKVKKKPTGLELDAISYMEKRLKKQ